MTDRRLRGLTHADGELADEKTGLLVRADQAGAVTFSFRYRSGAARRRISIRRYPTVSLAQARIEAGRIREAVRAGGDPQQQRRDRRDRTLTFDELCDRSLQLYARPQKASWRDDESHLRNARRAWGRRDAASITRQDVARLLFEIVPRAPVKANRLRSVLLKMYGWAVDAALLDVNPARDTRKPHRERRGKDRTLNDAEIRTLWRAFDATTKAEPATTAALKCVLLLGSRPGEVSGMAASELQHLDDPSRAVWIIPAARMKRRRAHAVPLPALARAIIGAELARQQKPEFVFASKYASRAQLARNSMSEALARIIDELEGDTDAVASLQANRVTPHDFRRTVATGLSRLNVPREDRLSLLAHSFGDVHEQHYDHFDRLPQRRAALEKWQRYLRRIIADKSAGGAEIVALHAPCGMS